MTELDIAYQTAANLLRELTHERKLRKFGRGSTAIWKHKVVENVEPDHSIDNTTQEIENLNAEV
jgi:hypothetical protein